MILSHIRGPCGHSNLDLSRLAMPADTKSANNVTS